MDYELIRDCRKDLQDKLIALLNSGKIKIVDQDVYDDVESIVYECLSPLVVCSE